MAREYPDVRTFSLLLVILRYRRKMLQNISMMLPKTNGIEACIGDLVEHYQSWWYKKYHHPWVLRSTICRCENCNQGYEKKLGTSERRSCLDTHISAHNYIYYMPKLNGNSRISSCHNIIQKMLFSYPLLNHFFEHSETGAEKLLFTNISFNNWGLLEEMEAIVDPLAVFPHTSCEMEQLNE